ncbi:MAG: prolyl oligopeptidase family serine peptidase [Pyrinomonadaceae bacterium]|nr:prolyl oligopeptidase family serine peptidase [Pyrinomonadaceae bacterium]MCX7639429.1 prolyl oligopeptidase family serine peptidase [Pyrinomonadaceae bacterium]
MKKLAFLSMVCILAMSVAAQRIEYPRTKKVDQVDEYHGIKVADPYRWLEDANSPETKAWIEAQNKITRAYLDSIPEREKVKRRLTELWDYERYSLPLKRGNKYFYLKNDGLQNQSVLYVADSLESEGRVLLDPNKLSADGTVALSGFSVDEDGKLLAYGISSGGSDWQEWRIREVETGRDLSDVIRWVKFSSVSWTKDGKGFFYSRYPEPDEKTKLAGQNFYHKLYYHKIGTDQSEDILVYERSDHKEWGFGGTVTEDGRYLIINVWRGTDPRNLIFYKDLTREGSKVVELISEFENDYTFLGNDGKIFYFQTDNKAPRRRIIAIDIEKPEPENWREIVSQQSETISSASIVGNYLIVSYLKDAYVQTKIFDLSGKFVRHVKYPTIGMASGFGGRREDKETFYVFTSFAFPPTIYRYNLETGESKIFRQPSVKFNANEIEVKQVFYNSKDGTRVPMFIVHKKGIKLNGNNPTLLYGYGGFNVSLTPSFSVSRIVWLEMGGVFAMPNLRGGGEYGEEWHKAGTKLKKQNVFDDFIAAAEWLIQNKYTSPSKLAISGASNGGLLVGAVLNQRPDLFAAALPAVGVMDMLRFHKFTIGWAWISDYGSPENPEEFKALYAYSPLHNIRKGTKYPAVLITTADHDDRVVPAHSFKYAATLQEAQAGEAPILIRIETRAGHGAGKPTSKQIEEQADVYAFLIKNLKMKID